MSEGDRKRVHGWQRDCANVLDEATTSSQAAGRPDQLSSAQDQAYLFEGQLSQAGLANPKC